MDKGGEEKDKDTPDDGSDLLMLETMLSDTLGEGTQGENGLENTLGETMSVTEARQDDLANQLCELQGMMLELKDGFVHAMEELGKIQNGDQVLQDKLESTHTDQGKQLGELQKSVNSLREEFQNVVESHQNLKLQVDQLQQERDTLLQELEKTGAITQQLKQRLATGVNGLVSGPDNNHVTSDQDSGVATFRPDLSSHGDATPPLMSPMVKPFIAGLQNTHSHRSPDNYDANYDSDSSLIEAANKSLNLSRSLGAKCMDIDQSESSDEGSDNEKENKIYPPSPGRRSHNGSFSPRKLPPHELTIRETQRSKVAKELLETERKYCSNLWTVLDVFAEPIKQTGVISSKDVNVMFPSSLSRLYNLHCNLLHTLEERLMNWKRQCVIGDVFSRFTESNSDILGTYRIYVHDFPNAVSTINKCYRQSGRFRKCLKNCQKQPSCEGLDLTAFLLTPIQRIPRYVLLLKQLVKYTDMEHPDYYYLEVSLDKLGSFLNQLNNSIEHSMHLVGLDGGAKPQRKSRSGNSLRSSSSSQDGMQFAISSHNPAGFDASYDRNNGRRHPLGIFRNQSGRHGNQHHHSDSSEFMDPHMVPIPRDKQGNRDATFSNDAANYSKGRSKPRKTKSKRLHKNDIIDHTQLEEGGDFRIPQKPARRTRNQRPKSMIEPALMNETSFFTTTHEDEIDPPYDLIGKKKSRKPKKGVDSGGDFLSVSMKDLVADSDRSPNDYGIFGEDDSIYEEPEYQPSMVAQDAVTRKAQKLGLGQKSKSQGNILLNGSETPSQQHINMLLARSLTEANLGDSGLICDGEADSRVLAGKSRSQVLEQEPPERVLENVWDSPVSQQDTTMNGSVNPRDDKSRRKKLKDKKKDRQRQIAENLSPAARPESGAGLKKKRSLRDSLRNIFFRKRGASSRVVEIDTTMDPQLSPGEDGTLKSSDFSDINIQLNTERGAYNMPDGASRISLDFTKTYEDENGDPCSAV